MGVRDRVVGIRGRSRVASRVGGRGKLAGAVDGVEAGAVGGRRAVEAVVVVVVVLEVVVADVVRGGGRGGATAMCRQRWPGREAWVVPVVRPIIQRLAVVAEASGRGRGVVEIGIVLVLTLVVLVERELVERQEHVGDERVAGDVAGGEGEVVGVARLGGLRRPSSVAVAVGAIRRANRRRGAVSATPLVRCHGGGVIFPYSV